MHIPRNIDSDQMPSLDIASSCNLALNLTGAALVSWFTACSVIPNKNATELSLSPSGQSRATSSEHVYIMLLSYSTASSIQRCTTR